MAAVRWGMRKVTGSCVNWLIEEAIPAHSHGQAQKTHTWVSRTPATLLTMQKVTSVFAATSLKRHSEALTCAFTCTCSNRHTHTHHEQCWCCGLQWLFYVTSQTNLIEVLMAFSAHFDHKICKETEQRTDRKTVTMRPVDCVCLWFERLLILSISTFELI